MKELALGLLGAFLLSTASYADIVGREVDYQADGVQLKGYIAYDNNIRGKRPGIVVVHEWWGHNEYVRHRARMLAKLGYTALAVDMYGAGKHTRHPADAQKFVQEAMANMPEFEDRFRAGLKILRNEPTVDPERIAAIGYCFGGGTVLNMARAGMDLKGVVSFHGTLAPAVKAKPGGIKAKILVCYGGADTLVPPEALAAFKKEMDAAGADYEIKVYPGAKHAFTNPGADLLAKETGLSAIGYNKKADQQSWKDMQAFFAKIFPNRP